MAQEVLALQEHVSRLKKGKCGVLQFTRNNFLKSKKLKILVQAAARNYESNSKLQETQEGVRYNLFIWFNSAATVKV